MENNPHWTDLKEVIGIVLPPRDYYYGLKEYSSRWFEEGEWGIQVYDLQRAIQELLKCNYEYLCLLWLEDNLYIRRTGRGEMLLDNKSLFIGKHIYENLVHWARIQLEEWEPGHRPDYGGMKRRILVERFGYNTIDASRLIMLLRMMCIELMISGEINVMRQDAHELMEIKRGEWSLGQVKDEIRRLLVKSEDALIASKLPEKPDREKIHRLCLEISR